MDKIIAVDQAMMRWIHQNISNEFLDVVLPFMRGQKNWYPFYIALVVFLLVKYKLKGLWITLGAVAAVGVGDITSSHLIKKSVERLRPCRTEGVEEYLHTLVHCGSGFSFTSSHAVNHFVIAVFFILVFKKELGYWAIIPLAWAAIIALSQVYVGVHYPLDIAFGSLLGTLIGYAMFKLYTFTVNKFNQQL